MTESIDDNYRVFICYRQIDGAYAAEWLHGRLHGAKLGGHSTDAENQGTLEVYLDKSAPAVPNWRAIHQPALELSRAFLMVCSPGAYAHQGEDDWVHKELDWWLKHRSAAPILIETNNSDGRWVPERINQRWPNAQRISVQVDSWKNSESDEDLREQDRAIERITQGILRSERQVTYEELERRKKNIQLLRIAAVLLVLISGIAIWQSVLAANRLAASRPFADSQQLVALREYARNELWPSKPELVPLLMEWLSEATRLADRSFDYQQQLQSTPASETGDRSDSPFEVSPFGKSSRQWRYMLLQQLVPDLEEFTSSNELGDIPDVRARLEFARTVYKRSVTDCAAKWEKAAASIQSNPLYGGLQLAPQTGLIPLWENPNSGLWEFGHLETGSIPSLDTVTLEPEMQFDTGLVFVLIPGGPFWMGSQSTDDGKPNYDKLSLPNEQPVHSVELRAFFLSKFEMTQGQWVRVAKVNRSLYQPGAEQDEGVFTLLHPVEKVSWDDCVEVLGRMHLALPTEAQWEYAARGGTPYPWWSGLERDSVEGTANFADKTASDAGKTWGSINEWPDLVDGHAVHAPIGQYRPNPFGLMDIYGNLWEWCQDALVPYSESVNPGDGHRASKDPSKQRVRRGSCYTYGASWARNAFRTSAERDYRTLTTGVRPMRRVE